MKKLIFQKFLGDTFKFFVITSFSIGIIVWIIQAVNFLDFVTEDGHGLYVYFSYTALNFPKIIHRVFPFVFFISIFYQIYTYELKNELLIFWTSGVNKIRFVNAIIAYSLIFLVFQILLGSYISPLSQNEARSFIRNSNIDFLPSLLKEGTFIDAVENLTIFVESKDLDGNFNNIFLEETRGLNANNDTKNSQIIYAKHGRLRDDGKNRYLELTDGNIIDRNNEKVNNFSYKKVNFDLNKFNSKTTSFPKIQEQNIITLINCMSYYYKGKIKDFYSDYLSCRKDSLKPIIQEIFKRCFQPFYLPLIALLTCLMVLKSKEDKNYNLFKSLIFLIVLTVIIISEISLKYIYPDTLSVLFFLLFPFVLFLIVYIYFINKFNYNFKT